MFQKFDSLDNLIEIVRHDKNTHGMGNSSKDRYPIRFILFDNFKDSVRFIGMLMQIGITKMQKIVDWIDKDYPDVMLSHNRLSKLIIEYVEQNPTESSIIVPFSELARYYRNDDVLEFDALVSSVKSIQASSIAINSHQRIYIPLVGQYQKMSTFFEDSQMNIWAFENKESLEEYKMVLTKSTYEVKGLELRYSIVNSVVQWLELWKQENVKEKIIVTSQALNSLSQNAEPDNAITYIKCNNVYEFLTKGLNIEFGNATYRKSEDVFWQKAAQKISYSSYNFKEYIENKFQSSFISNINTFCGLWQDSSSEFDRWLLVRYAEMEETKGSCKYLLQALRNIESLDKVSLWKQVMLDIFDIEEIIDDEIRERYKLVGYLKANKIVITDDCVHKLENKIEVSITERGITSTVKYLTDFTDIEKQYLVKFYNEGYITTAELKELFPDLSIYLETNTADFHHEDWLNKYFSAYTKAKITGEYTEDIHRLISLHNANECEFDDWYQSFRTVRTELDSHKDIDVYYWIDGLGVDWIPYIQTLIENKKSDNIFINETLVAKAMLPTVTSINKIELEKLSENKLYKEGDLDSKAHVSRSYPNYIFEEIKLIRSIIESIISKYSGKKIALISDHGISYLSQYRKGFNMSGVSSDHAGRLAYVTSKSIKKDDSYIILQDKKILTALMHESLTHKVPGGQGCHGGCTPEEVLVPIFIMSSVPNNNKFSVEILNNEINGQQPYVKIRIERHTSGNKIIAVFDDKEYSFIKESDKIFKSEELPLLSNVNKITIKIGEFSKDFAVKVNVGAEEDDLFDF